MKCFRRLIGNTLALSTHTTHFVIKNVTPIIPLFSKVCHRAGSHLSSYVSVPIRLQFTIPLTVIMHVLQPLIYAKNRTQVHCCRLDSHWVGLMAAVFVVRSGRNAVLYYTNTSSLLCSRQTLNMMKAVCRVILVYVWERFRDG
jgi:hypothetical protein